jgi:hypothetical protein
MGLFTSLFNAAPKRGGFLLRAHGAFMSVDEFSRSIVIWSGEAGRKWTESISGFPAVPPYEYSLLRKIQANKEVAVQQLSLLHIAAHLCYCDVVLKEVPLQALERLSQPLVGKINTTQEAWLARYMVAIQNDLLEKQDEWSNGQNILQLTLGLLSFVYFGSEDLADKIPPMEREALRLAIIAMPITLFKILASEMGLIYVP